eukprot:1189221-Rhodomonas_salina.1
MADGRPERARLPSPLRHSVREAREDEGTRAGRGVRSRTAHVRARARFRRGGGVRLLEGVYRDVRQAAEAGQAAVQVHRGVRHPRHSHRRRIALAPPLPRVRSFALSLVRSFARSLSSSPPLFLSLFFSLSPSLPPSFHPFIHPSIPPYLLPCPLLAPPSPPPHPHLASLRFAPLSLSHSLSLSSSRPGACGNREEQVQVRGGRCVQHA